LVLDHKHHRKSLLNTQGMNCKNDAKHQNPISVC
jgi:hypothetical protein